MKNPSSAETVSREQPRSAQNAKAWRVSDFFCDRLEPSSKTQNTSLEHTGNYIGRMPQSCSSRSSLSLVGITLGAAFAILGFVITASWSYTGQPILQIDGGAPLRANAAFALFLMGSSLLLAFCDRRRRIAQYLAVITTILCAVTLFQYFFDVALVTDYLLVKQNALGTRDYTARMSPNFATVMFLSSIAVVLLSSPYRSYRTTLVSAHLALLSLVIGGMALYGYLVDIEIVYGWGLTTKIGPQSAAIIVVLSLFTLFWAWTEFDLHSARLPSLSRTIIVLSTTGVFFIAILSATIGMISFYDLIEKDLKERFHQEVDRKRLLVERMLLQFQVEAKGLSIKDGSVQFLSDYNSGKLTQAELRNTLDEALSDDIEKAKLIGGLTRFDSQQVEVFSSGPKLSKEILSSISHRKPLNNKDLPVYGPIQIDNDYYILSLIHLRGNDGSIIATDWFSMPLTRLYKSLMARVNVGENVSPSLIVKDRSQGAVFVPQHGKVEFSVHNLPRDSFLAKFVDGSKTTVVKQRVGGRSPVFAAFAPVRQTNLFLVVTVETSALAAELAQRFWRIGSAILVVALLAGFFMYIIVRALIVRAGDIQQELRNVSKSLQRELHTRMQSEKDLKASLKERDVLLKEVHHRVKNNLQIISSIFNLQRRRTTDENLRTLLEESRSRVQSMAALHETLYQSDSLSTINMRRYISAVVDKITSSVSKPASPEIKVETCLDDISLGIDQAIPSGLIVNELLTNSLKHAFAGVDGDRSRQVIVRLSQKEDNVVELSVVDNGKGFSKDFDMQSNQSLGLRLVSILSQQLNAQMKVDGSRGASFTFNIPSQMEGH